MSKVLPGDDFARYETLRDNGKSPADVLERGRGDGLDQTTLIRMLRAVFDLTLIEAKQVLHGGEIELTGEQAKLADNIGEIK